MKMRKVNFDRSLYVINYAFISVLVCTIVIFSLFYVHQLPQATLNLIFVFSLVILCSDIVICVSISFYAFAQKPKLELCLNVFAFQIKELVTYFNRKTPNLEIVYQMWV